MTYKTSFLLLSLCLFVIEVSIALYATNTFIRNFFGDFLVVILIYSAVKSLFHIKPMHLAIAVFIFATILELMQLIHIVDILKIDNKILRIAIGNSFSVYDLLMYLMGCVTIFIVDCVFMMPKFKQHPL